MFYTIKCPNYMPSWSVGGLNTQKSYIVLCRDERLR